VALGATGGEAVFARVYAHSGMVAYEGQKMSKSLGNLVFVSRLRESGVDPMAIRLALLAHHYRSDWEWTDEVLSEAIARLANWRSAVAAAGNPGSAGSAGSAGFAGSVGSAGSAGTPGSARSAGSAGSVGSTGFAGSANRARTVGFARPASTAGPVSGSSSSSAPTIPLASAVLQAVRERMADDLDAPGALAVIDEWADAVAANGAIFEGDAALVRDTADALLGIAL
jgi:cysteinyl-tRNA synthetase